MNIIKKLMCVPKRTLCFLLTCLFLCLSCFFFAACNHKQDFTSYVSEYRNNLFLYEGEGFTIKAQNVEKEYPYVADGYKGEMNCRVEFYVSAPADTRSCEIYFWVDGTKHGGEASFDTVKRQFYFSCAASVANATALPVQLHIDGVEWQLTLNSVKTPDLLPLSELLTKLFSEESTLKKKLAENGELACELYVRILYEDAPYFYVGVVDRKGTIHAFLLNGQTGKILARRTT